MRRGTGRVLLYKRPVVAAGGGATTTLNPFDKAANVTLSGGNLVGTNTVGGGAANVRSVASYSTGKKYCEATMTVLGTGYDVGLGIGNSSASLTDYIGNPDANSQGYFPGVDPLIYGSDGTKSVAVAAQGDVICMAADFVNDMLWFRINGGNWNNSGTADPATNVGGSPIIRSKPMHVILCLDRVGGVSQVVTFNFGATAYAQTAPSGFGNW